MGLYKLLKGKVSQRRDVDENTSTYVEAGIIDSKGAQVYVRSSSETRNSPNTVRDHTNLLDSYNTPPGPPPSRQHPVEPVSNPPPDESWLSVPDTSDFPPPPALQNEYSSANNATFSAAEQGHRWCAAHPVYTPTVPPNPAVLEHSQARHLGLETPAGRHFAGRIKQIDPTTWEVKTDKTQQDATLMSTVPIYFAAVSNPMLAIPSSIDPSARGAHSVAFAMSVSITHLHRKAGIAIGFASKPYPPYRLPGWHRASLAIHSDDGNRYVNDPHGGIDFMSPFNTGDTIRLVVTVYPTLSPVQRYRGKYTDQKPVEGGLPKCQVRCEVMRNGNVEGSWDMHEERDAERDEGVEGLQGEADLYCAVGVFGEIEAIVRYESVS